MSGVVVEGKTIEEAVDQACSQLQVPRNRVRFVVLEAPKKRFLGLFGSTAARVQVEVVTSVKEDVASFLQQTVEKMGIDVSMSVEEPTKRDVIYQFSGDDIALLIGKNGQTLESLQHLVNRIFFADMKKQKVKAWLDANGYRKRKENFLIGLAERTGELVLRTKKKIVLDSMPASERKVIHTTLQGGANLRTESIGVEPERCVAIHWKP